MNSTPTDQTIQHVIQSYVKPARKRGESSLQVRVGNVQKELGWNNRTPSIFSTLGSKRFQEEAGLMLIEKRDGPPSGGPSTTVKFIYRILASVDQSNPVEKKPAPNGAGLLDLCGILSTAYKQLGGGEEYLTREREELRFPAEGYPRKFPQGQE